MKHLPCVVALAFAALAGAVSHPRAQETQIPSTTSATTIDTSTADNPEPITGWFCPMHQDHTAHEAGKCPICGMALIPGNPYDTRDYVLDFTTLPVAVPSGMPFTMIFSVRHPRTGDVVKNYEVVHDKRYHLFVVSQDLTDFQHLHPELQTDGSWELRLTLPKPGYYRVLSDFVPSGGSPQFLGRTLVTTDFDEDLESQAAHIEPDAVLTKTVDSTTASVELDPLIFIAGQYGHLRFTLTDAATGQPITDLQPYLGAFGHTLILSEDLREYVHSHPSEWAESEVTKGFGGPYVTFEGYMPHPGRYRAWSQFLRKDHLTTVSFTFNVLALEDAVRMQK
ncbi:MAG: hypothetical protein HOP16_16845 [Acidobacteria bacterium]|nr:hypothetical protein [Acidobacteriota bacterium]